MHLKVRPAAAVSAEIRVPGDKSISHRAVLLAALSNGSCRISNFLAGEDCLATVAAMEKLGVAVDRVDDTTLVIHGTRGVLSKSQGEIDCGNSGTSMRLLAGVLAGQPFSTRLVGDPSLSRRPMKRVIEPLSRMGARLAAEGEGGTPPLVVEGGSLAGTEYVLPVASAQVKSAILLAGMFARGETTVVEPAASRDHTERMLEYFLVQTRRERNRITIYGDQRPESRDFEVPGDISSAAFWVAAAAAHPSGHVTIRNVGLNPTRTGILAVLARMGAKIREKHLVDEGEPAGALDVRGGVLKGTIIEGDEIPNVIDEIPILAVAGALAEGKTIIRDAGELRVKETDRISAIATNLRAMGGVLTEHEDWLEIQGPTALRGARLSSFGDHRIAMAFAIAGLFAEGETIIDDASCIDTSYPGFEKTLESLIRGGGERGTGVVDTFPPSYRKKRL